MSSPRPSNFINLEKSGDIRETDLDDNSVIQFRKTAEGILQSAKVESLTPHSKFILGYESIHMLFLAVIASYGYLPGKEKGHRSLILTMVAQHIKLSTEQIMLLSEANDRRNEKSYRVPLPPVSRADAAELIELADDVFAQAKTVVPTIFKAQAKVK